MAKRIQASAAFAAALALPVSSLQAQPAPAPDTRAFAVTSMPADTPDRVRADALIAERTRSGELTLISAEADRQLPGRLHEYFGQVHRGVPVLGAGLSRQQADGATVSVFGTVFSGIDVETEPGLSAEAALARMQELAGALPATSEPPRLFVLPTVLGRFVLAWSAPMQDYRTYFIDAHGGELVYRIDHIHAQSAVGFGLGITGAPQKLSVWNTGSEYEARDRLRPAEIVTLDAQGDLSTAFDLLLPTPAWEEAVASDDDNEWSNAAFVDGHAHLGWAYDYLFKSHGWRGMDGQDGRIFSIVNIEQYANAFFISAPFGPEGGGALVFGETPDGTPFVPLDVSTHELMHGVTYSALTARTGLPLIGQHLYTLGTPSFPTRDGIIRCGDSHTFADGQTAPYLCFDEDGNFTTSIDEDGNFTTSRGGRVALFLAHGGAINEAYSDIVGTAVEFAFHPPGDGLLRADYLSGEDMELTIRRMDNPRADRVSGIVPYPDAIGQEFRFVVALVGENLIRYTRYFRKDNRWFQLFGDGYRGVHWNSTILSHAFYLAIEGGTHVSSGRTVEGVGGANRLLIEQAFFRALVDLAPPDVNFQTMATAIRQAAVDLHGDGSPAHAAIDQALETVGL